MAFIDQKIIGVEGDIVRIEIQLFYIIVYLLIDAIIVRG